MKIAVFGCGDGARYIEDSPYNGMKFNIEYYVLSDLQMHFHKGKEVRNIESIDWDSIDYLVISSYRFKEEIIKSLELRTQKYNMYKKKIIMRYEFLRLFNAEQSVYDIVTVRDGISYIFRKEDTVLGPMMCSTGENYSCKEIDDLIKISGCRMDGYFLDIGANIGTTCVYVKKKYPDMKVIGFEPGKENYCILSANCALNDVAIQVENIGLGSIDEERGYRYLPNNPGGSAICDEYSEYEETFETVKITSLDNYLNSCKIDPRNISFIWMDTEGFESEVIIGAEKTLKSKRIPLVHEFNPQYYIRKQMAERYSKIMQECYSYYIDVRNRNMENLTVLPISNLINEIHSDRKQTDLFFF